MPVARIVSRRFQEALEFAENLRSRFDTIEIAAPDQRFSGEVDLEIRLDNCSSRAALGQLLEYLADHPSGARAARNVPEQTERTTPEPAAAARLAILQDVSNSSPAPEAATPAPLAAHHVHTPWLRAVSAWVRSAGTTRKPVQSMNEAAASAARLRRELRDDRFWIPPAYKSPAWTEAERQRRSEAERRRISQLAMQKADALQPERPAAVEATSDTQIPASVPAMKDGPLAPALPVASARFTQEAVAQPRIPVPASLVAISAGPPRTRQTLTPRLRQLEARRWKQAAAMATAVAALITVTIIGFENRGTVQAPPTEVESEPMQALPVKPAADDGTAKSAVPILLSSAADSDAQRSGAARLSGWRKRTAGDEVDYIASDVIVRHFEENGAGRANREASASESRARTRGHVKTISDFERPVESPANGRSRSLQIKQISDFNLR
jgi:hypothetical protein